MPQLINRSPGRIGYHCPTSQLDGLRVSPSTFIFNLELNLPLVQSIVSASHGLQGSWAPSIRPHLAQARSASRWPTCHALCCMQWPQMRENLCSFHRSSRIIPQTHLRNTILSSHQERQPQIVHSRPLLSQSSLMIPQLTPGHLLQSGLCLVCNKRLTLGTKKPCANTFTDSFMI